MKTKMNLGGRSVATLLVLTLFVSFPAPALIQGKVRAKTETAWGLHTATFDTPHGKIKVHLPDDLSAGDTISGTVIAEPAGKTEEERIKNQDELNGYVVEIGKKKTPVLEKVLQWAVPAAVAASAFIILRDNRGKELARTQCPIQQPPASVPPGRPAEPIPPGGRPPFTPPPQPADYQLPTLGQAGRPVEIQGPFNGDFGNTKVEIGGTEAQPLAESPRKLIAQSPTQVTGPTTIKLKEGDVTAEGSIRNIAVGLSARETKLRPGQQTTLTVEVQGLEKPESLPLPELKLRNMTPGVVRMEGGDVQTISIRREDVSPEGTFTFTRTLTGIRPGSFVITAFILPHVFFAPTFHDIKQALGEDEFRDLLTAIIDANNEEIEKIKKLGDKADAGQKMRKNLLEATNNKLNAAKQVLPLLDKAKTIADEALDKLNVIETGASLVATAFGNPLSKLTTPIRAIKTIVKAMEKEEKDDKKKKKIQEKLKELEDLEKEAEQADKETDKDKKEKIKGEIKKKLEEIGNEIFKK
jgi:hypothetical protein